jgi:hypothetical protein
MLTEDERVGRYWLQPAGSTDWQPVCVDKCGLIVGRPLPRSSRTWLLLLACNNIENNGACGPGRRCCPGSCVILALAQQALPMKKAAEGGGCCIGVDVGKSTSTALRAHPGVYFDVEMPEDC